MIIGSIKDRDAAFPAALERALAYLRDTDFSKVADGRYDIDGDRIYAKVQRYRTKPVGECRPESHCRYLDVQFVAEGEEFLGWCAFSPELKVAEPYDEENDIVFYEKLRPESECLLTKGSFAVLMPKDVHQPCCAVGEPSPVLKVVVKIAVELMEEGAE